MKEYIYFSIALILLIPVSALTCAYDANPFIYLTSEAAAFCYSDNLTLETECFTTINYNGDLLRVNPVAVDVDNYGRVSTYAMREGLSLVEFNLKGLHEGVALNASVFCGSENVTFEIVPSLVDYQEITEQQIKFNHNTYNIWWAVLSLTVILILLGLVYRIAK